MYGARWLALFLQHIYWYNKNSTKDRHGAWLQAAALFLQHIYRNNRNSKVRTKDRYGAEWEELFLKNIYWYNKNCTKDRHGAWLQAAALFLQHIYMYNRNITARTKNRYGTQCSW